MCDSAALGVIEAAEENGIFAASSGDGQETVGPNCVAISVVKDTSVVYEQAFKAYLNGELTGDTGIVKLGAKDGVVYLTDWFACADGVSEDVKAAVAAAYKALASGEITIELG
jgi:basic membrane lipoprotein Med (substrate-binding protein (PBP1-ABC) superfamily)